MEKTLHHAKFLTLRFSGCGHLLPYHLGVSSVLLEEESRRRIRSPLNTYGSILTTGKEKEKFSLPMIKAVSGSSAGAIAAVVYAQLPHRLEEYASEFISKKGRALELLKQMLYEEERARTRCDSDRNVDSSSSTPTIVTRGKHNQPPSLHIATTRCSDGSHHLFTFPPHLYPSISSSWNTDNILEAVKASCTIPQSFHPADIVFESQRISYPDSDGILINGEYHVDGGIAAPVPPTPRDGHDGAYPITISPISFANPLILFGAGSKDDECVQRSQRRRISPEDDSMRLLPFSNISCRGNFQAKPSIQNLRALRIASGITSSGELQEWYDRGADDARRMLRRWSAEPNFNSNA